LNSLARHVARDRRVVPLAPDFVDFVDVHDAALGGREVVAGGLQEAVEDGFHVVADVACLRERRRVRHHEGHLDQPRQGARQQGLAGAGRAEEEHV